VTRRGRFLQWLATRLPQPLAESPERVFINIICSAVGAAAIVNNRPSPLWTHSGMVVWGLTMLFGGVAALVGYWDSTRKGRTTALARVGYLAILLATLTYALRVIDVAGWRAVPVATAFLGIAAAKAVRLLVSSAARERVLHGAGEPGDGK
jgi:hypothetical protein